MRKKYKYLFVLACLFFFFNKVFAQKSFNEYLAKYPNEKFVFLKTIKNYNIDLVKGELKVSESNKHQNLVLSDSPSSFSEGRVAFSDFRTLEKLKAYTLVPNGDKYKKIDVKDFTEKHNSSESSFDSDIKQKEFIYPNITKGAIICKEFDLLIKEPRFISGCYFGAYAISEYIEMNLKVNKNVKIDFYYFNCDSSDFETNRYTKGNYIYYTFVKRNIPKTKYASNTIPEENYLPHIIPLINSYNNGKETISVSANLDDLYRWYYSLIKDAKNCSETQLKELSDSLSAGKKTDLEKVKAIYYWVQDNIKYIAFEAGMEGFIPQLPENVFTHKFGDCKGMANITQAMINFQNIPCYLTWVGSRKIGYDYTDIPSTMCDNHMIATYINDTNYYFLDATGSEVPIHLTTSFIQGKQALIAKDSVNYEIVRIPVFQPETNLEIDSNFVSLNLENTQIEGNTKHFVSGLNAIYYRRKLKHKLNEEIEEYLSNFFKKGNNKCKISNVTTKNIAEKDSTLKINYDLEIPDYAIEAGGKIYINLNFDKFNNKDYIEKDRELPIEIDMISLTKIVTVFNIPEGYVVEHLPENSASNTNDLYNFSITYEIQGNKIIHTTELEEKNLVIYPEDFEKWNEIIKNITNEYSKSIVLSKK